MGRDKLPIVELFKSIQGEGPFQGRLALFVRLGFCNLKCTFCDTKYALKPAKNWTYFTPHELARKLIHSYPDVVTHLVITGGEPMLHEELIFNTLRLLLDRVKLAEIETNGTIAPGLLHKFSFVTFNVSPKLSNSGEKRERRIVKEALSAYSDIENTFFKFVIKNRKDIEEVLEIKDSFFIPSNRIYLMPLASTKAQLRATEKLVFELALKHGFNYSCRIQVEASRRVKNGV